MERRDFAKMLGGIGGASVLGVGGIAAFAGGASATANASYGDVTVTSDDGTVEYVAIYGQSSVSWDGFDSTATSFEITQEARIPGQVGWVQLNNTGEVSLSNSDWGGSNEELSGPGTSGTISTGIGVRSNGNHNPATDWHVVGSDPDGYGLPANSINPSNLEVTSDGSTEEFDIELRSTYVWYDDTNDVILEKQFTSVVDVTVNNEPSSATATSENSGAVGE